MLNAARELGYNHAATVGPPTDSGIVAPGDPARRRAMNSSFWVEVISGGRGGSRAATGFKLTVDVLSDRGPEILDDKVSGLILAGRRSRGVIEPFLALPLPKC